MFLSVKCEHLYSDRRFACQTGRQRVACSRLRTSEQTFEWRQSQFSSKD